MNLKQLFIIIWCSLALLLLLPDAHAQEPPPDNQADLIEESPFKRNIEWFGMHLGWGMNFVHIEESYFTSMIGTRDEQEAVATFNLFNIQYDHFHCTILEIHPMMFVGYLGGGVRLGGRIPLVPSYEHEIRIGSYVGVDAANSILGFATAVTFMPHVQYVYNMAFGSVGVGLDLPVNVYTDRFHIEGGDGHEDTYGPVSGGFLIYFRFTAGRTGFSRSSQPSP